MKKINSIIFQAESVAHLRGFEKEILPLVDLTKELVEIIKRSTPRELNNIEDAPKITPCGEKNI